MVKRIDRRSLSVEKSSTNSAAKSVPAYQKVASDLRATLKSAGQSTVKLPTEAELSETYGVSRQTIRRAYQELVSDGLVERTAGRGTFASATGPYVRSFGSIADLMAISDGTILEVVEPLGEIDASEEVRKNFDTERIYGVVIRRLNEGAPFVHTSIMLPEDLGRLLKRTFLTRRGSLRATYVIQMLDDRTPLPITTAFQTVTVVRTPADIAPQLDMRRGDPALQIERLYRDRSGRCVEMMKSFFNPDRYTYRLEMRRGSSGR